MKNERTSFYAAIIIGLTAFTGCEPASATRPPPETAILSATLARQVIADTQMSLDDIVSRLIPSLDDANTQSELRILIATFETRVAKGDAEGAERSLAAFDHALNAYSASLGETESPDVGAIRIALSQAGNALNMVREAQLSAAQY